MAYYPFATEKGAFYRLVGPDGSIATFNDPFDPNYVGYITELSGLDAAEVRESAQDLTEADGGSHGYFYMARRPIVISALVANHATIFERNVRVDRARRASLALRGDSTLSWRPSIRQENMLSNPRAAVDLTGLTGTTAGMTATRTTTNLPGSFTTGVSITGTAAATTSAGPFWGLGTTSGTGTSGVPVQPGVPISGAASIRLVSVTSGTMNSLRVRVYWYKSDGTASSVLVQTDFGVTNTPASATDFILSGSVTPPSDAAYAAFRPFFAHTNPITYTATFTGFRAGGTTYVDGDTAGYYWQGVPHASPSGDYVEMFTTVRRQQPFREAGNWTKELQIPLVSEYATLFSTGIKNLTGSPVSCENRGNYVAYPILEITGASVNPRVTDAAGGDFRTTGLTLAAGEVVQFDMLNHTGSFTSGARVGQSATRYIDFSLTKWVTLPAAATTNVTFTSGGGTMRVLWRDAWA